MSTTRHKILIVEAATVKKLITMKEVIREVDKGFRLIGEGKGEMPPKTYVNLDKYNGDLRAMPAYVEGFKACGIKWVNVHPDNRKKGLPTVMAMMILNDPATGLPLCIMDASYATALRTGAAGGVAAKYLARKDSKSVGLVGCGVQARTQLAALAEIIKIQEVYVWGKNARQAKELAGDIRKGYGVSIFISKDPEECVKERDIIVTTTPSRRPLIKRGWIKEGAHINAIGADARGKQELESAILKNAKLVVDSWAQASHSGEINVSVAKKRITKKDIYSDICQLAAGKKKGRSKEKEITVFDSTGLAVQDIAIANLIYRKAKNLKNIKSMNF